MSRVLQLLTNNTPGGVPVPAAMVAEGLVARGHEVETLVLRQGPGLVARRILTGRYDGILSYQVAAGLVGALLGGVVGVRVRASHLTAIPSAMRGPWRVLDRWFGLVGLHTAIIANSAATVAAVDTYPQRYQSRLRLIPHGVAPLPKAVTGGWAGRLAIPSLAPLLVTAGRLAEQKNHQLAVAALAELPTAHLVIAGDGPLRPELLQQAGRLGVAARLHLVGHLDRSALAGLMAEADAFVFPSRWESFGLVAVEAGMAGLPVIAADLPVLREVLAPAGTVAFHPVDDASALAEAVRVLLADYPSSAQRHAAALALRQVYAVERMIDDYCRLIASN
ncbi:glycosyltransferase [Devosia sp. A369]